MAEKPQATLEQITGLASAVIADGDSVVAMTLARWIMENLAEAAPCGWGEPSLYRFSDSSWGVGVPDWSGVAVEPADARAMGRMLFTAADDAEHHATISKEILARSGKGPR